MALLASLPMLLVCAATLTRVLLVPVLIRLVASPALSVFVALLTSLMLLRRAATICARVRHDPILSVRKCDLLVTMNQRGIR